MLHDVGGEEHGGAATGGGEDFILSTAWLTGSRPEKGSSSKRSFGELTRAAASWTFWAMPFDRRSTRAAEKGARPKRSINGPAAWRAA